MRVALTLFRYFPFGGMQRDMLATARACQAAGHEVTIYCHTFEGERPQDLNVEVLAVNGRTNHGRARRFAETLSPHSADVVIGFDKMPGLDFYFAADPCFVTRTADRPWPYRVTPRYRTFRALEEAVFGAGSKTRILLLAAATASDYLDVYGTPPDRFVQLPPGIARDRRRGDDHRELRSSMRSEFGFADDDVVLLMLGANLQLKGIDRALHAIAALPDDLRSRTRLLTVGQDAPATIRQLAASLGVEFTALAGRGDVPRLLQGADALMHPAVRDTTGTVLLEAVAAGLPALCTAACGYAEHIERADAGFVVREPFEQASLDRALVELLQADRAKLSANALRYADEHDLHGMHEHIVRLLER